MNWLSILRAEFLYRPVFNLLIIFLALFWGNLWIAIVLLTIGVRLLLLRNAVAWANMSKGMSNIQPKMQELQEKYKDDPQKLSEETMKLLKKEGSAPLKGCLSMLIQLPIFIGLYFVIRAFATWTLDTNWLYSFFWSFGNKFLDPQNVNSIFLWIDLFEKNSIILTVLVACLNFIQFWLTSLTQKWAPKQQNMWWVAMPDMSKMMWTMNIMMTIMMASVVWSIQSWVGLYLATTSLFSIIQYTIQYRVLLKAKWDSLFHKNRPIVVETK